MLGKQGRMNQSAVLSQAPDAGLVRSDAELHHGGGVRLPGGEQFSLVQVRHCKLAWVEVGIVNNNKKSAQADLSQSRG